eukprot:g4503.t1
MESELSVSPRRILQVGESLTTDLEILWVLVGAYLVFFMQCGFAMLEAGTVRSKHTNNILLKNLVDACVAALIWWSVGFPLAFGKTDHAFRRFIGGNNFFLTNVDIFEDPTFYSRWIFQWAFAATSATIVSGAVAERCQFRAYIVYTMFITGLVYPFVVHWVWSDDGWLSSKSQERIFTDSMGLIDYAGASVVHITGGGAALIAAYLVGPRTGRFDTNGSVRYFAPHSLGLSLLGTFILWFGWYAFNPVSGLCVEGCMVVASLAAINTTLSAASGGVTVLLVHIMSGRPANIAPGLNGILSGLVAITAGCVAVEPYAAFIIGTMSGLFYFFASNLLVKLKIDDPLDAGPVHFVSGIWGTLAVGLFAKEANLKHAFSNFNHGDDFGLFYGGDGTQLGIQLLGIVVVASWSMTLNFFVFYNLKKSGWLRVPAEDEIVELAASSHGGVSHYNDTKLFNKPVESSVAPVM